MQKIFTSVGSRETPQPILDKLHNICAYLGKKGFIMRSGGADGADFWSEKGTDSVKGKKEIFLPYRGCFGNQSKLFWPNPLGEPLLRKVMTDHKDYVNLDTCKRIIKLLFLRNCQQVLGADLDKPTDFVVCYTQNGELIGGTRIAIMIANECKVPVFNYGTEGTDAKFKEFLKKNYKL